MRSSAEHRSRCFPSCFFVRFNSYRIAELGSTPQRQRSTFGSHLQWMMQRISSLWLGTLKATIALTLTLILIFIKPWTALCSHPTALNGVSCLASELLESAANLSIARPCSSSLGHDQAVLLEDAPRTYFSVVLA